MSIKATSQISIVDLTDAKSLSAYIASNLPKTQIFDPNTNVYNPDWTSGSKLQLTPTIFLNQSELPYGSTGLTITWKRKEGSGAEGNLVAGESVSNGILTVSQNKLSSITSGLLTYICKITYIDPETGITSNISADLTYSLIKTAMNAKLVSITGEQVFKYDKNSVVSPSQLTLTANTTNVNIVRWEYENGSGVWTAYPTSADNPTNTSSSLIIKPAHTVFFNDVAKIKVTTDDVNVEDIMSIFKVRDGATGADGADGSDGAAGKDAYTVILSNEAIIIPTDNNGKTTSSVNYTSRVIAYKGATKVTPSVGTISGQPTGMSVTKGSASNSEIPLTITVNSGVTLSGDNGAVTVPVTVDGNSFSKVFTWSKSKMGVKGDKGDTGANAVVFSIFAPNGQIFVNQEGTLLIEAVGYDGASEITTGATYKWYKYQSGSWVTISGQTSKSLSVSGSEVQGVGSFKCEMTYGGKTYSDVITLEDKTDSMLATIISTGGDVFKNTVGTSELICKVFQNGVEIDELKSTHIGSVAPTNPTSGTFWYKVDKTAKTVLLQKYNGSSWVNATGNDLHKLTYKWYRRDHDGLPLDSGSVFKTGKVIYIDGDDVEIKTTFICEVE